MCAQTFGLTVVNFVGRSCNGKCDLMKRGLAILLTCCTEFPIEFLPGSKQEKKNQQILLLSSIINHNKITVFFHKSMIAKKKVVAKIGPTSPIPCSLHT